MRLNSVLSWVDQDEPINAHTMDIIANEYLRRNKRRARKKKRSIANGWIEIEKYADPNKWFDFSRRKNQDED